MYLGLGFHYLGLGLGTIWGGPPKYQLIVCETAQDAPNTRIVRDAASNTLPHVPSSSYDEPRRAATVPQTTHSVSTHITFAAM